MSWYYKIIKHDAADEGEFYSEDWYGIHEFYENIVDSADGNRSGGPAWTENPVTITGETAQECIDQLNMMLADCVRQVEGDKMLERLLVNERALGAKRPWWRQVWDFVSTHDGHHRS
jgi:hypothetical protein